MSTVKSEIWNLIEPLVQQSGFELFDLEIPSGQAGGVLRVYVWKGKGGKIVLDDCASISKRIEPLTQLDEMIAGSYVLEVSSPGINRKLSRPEHFAGAVGERVKVVTEALGGKAQSIRGILLKSDGDVLEVQSEGGDGVVQLRLSEVKRAKVDFQFGNAE